MDKAVIYIHGKGGNAEEAIHYKPLFSNCDVIGLDYTAQFPWEAKEEFPLLFNSIYRNYKTVEVIANSIGAYFAINALSNQQIEKAYFISPVVDMERLIADMMIWANVTEDELKEKKEIQTTFGETLSWDYLCYARENPIIWEIPTHILYGEKDNLTAYGTIFEFVQRTIYRSYYCGLCDELKERYGVNGQLCISYDMTFLLLLLTGLYEPETRKYETRCIAHPLHRHPVSRNDISGYVADMNVLMTYYKCIDDWNDEKKVTRKVLADTLSGKVKRIEAAYPEKADIIKKALDKISGLEKAGEGNVDMPAEQFGIIMSQILLMKDDEWKDTLIKTGGALGRFIYILDAYEDLEEDNKKGRYNGLRAYSQRPDYDAFVENILKSLMAQCAAAFERLPVIENANLLRNIIYSGVWTRFELCRNKRELKTKNESQSENPGKTY